MANMFLGFPVPRAKIAEMIEGSAPPKTHASWHLPDGQDPIFPGDGEQAGKILQWNGTEFVWIAAPSGGMSSVYQDEGFHYKTFFPTLDEFLVTEYLTGIVTHSHDKTSLSSGETTGSYANIKKAAAYQNPVLTYDRNLFIRFKFKFNIYSDINPGSYIITAANTNEKHIGIGMKEEHLVSDLHDGSTRRQEYIMACGDGGAQWEMSIEIKFYAGSKVEYYVDGVLQKTETIGLPSGGFYDETFLKIAVYNSNTTRDIQMEMSMLELYQPPGD